MCPRSIAENTRCAAKELVMQQPVANICISVTIGHEIHPKANFVVDQRLECSATRAKPQEKKSNTVLSSLYHSYPIIKQALVFHLRPDYRRSSSAIKTWNPVKLDVHRRVLPDSSTDCPSMSAAISRAIWMPCSSHLLVACTRDWPGLRWTSAARLEDGQFEMNGWPLCNWPSPLFDGFVLLLGSMAQTTHQLTAMLIVNEITVNQSNHALFSIVLWKVDFVDYILVVVILCLP